MMERNVLRDIEKDRAKLVKLARIKENLEGLAEQEINKLEKLMKK